MSSDNNNYAQNIALLKSMGFPENRASQALNLSGGDIQYAIDLLSSNRDLSAGGDNEFDLLASREPEPAVQPATVFKPRTEREEPDHFREGSSTIGTILDSRIKSLVEMGFTPEDAEAALNKCNGDLNEALTSLLSK